MGEKNLPIKIILPRKDDIKKNTGMGQNKFFCEVNYELQEDIIKKLENVLDYYKDIFSDGRNNLAVGKISVRKEAIAKSHKPSRFCKTMPIIGSEKLDEIYIKVTESGIKETIDEVRNIPSEEFRANLSALEDIVPIKVEDKISDVIVQLNKTGQFEKIKDKIKIKLFNFQNEFDNTIVNSSICKRLDDIGVYDKAKFINYGSKIKYIKVKVNSFDQLIELAKVSGVKYIDFFQEYTLLDEEKSQVDDILVSEESSEEISDAIIGIIDGGISRENHHLEKWVYGREVYVPQEYQNPSHGTFIASTIQYGNILNNIEGDFNKRYKFLDVIAIPNSDEKFGLTDSIGEDELMDIVEEVVKKHYKEVKIWNISLGIPNKVCDGGISDLAVFFDFIQSEYNVQFIISSGNLVSLPLRTWPPQDDILERDRIISPADSVRAITVGSIAYLDSYDSVVKKNEPSPFSRRGPGANFIVKPDIVDYGGNCRFDADYSNIGMKGLDNNGKVIEGIGTSYSTPRIVSKYASIVSGLNDEDLLLAKAMLIHSARMNSRGGLILNNENIKYLGFGAPGNNINDILMCSESEITLIFKQKIKKGSHLELMDFPYPKSLIKNGRYIGEICMTLAYNPQLDESYGSEYCRTNIDVSFGTYNRNEENKLEFKGQVPLEKNWDSKFEKDQVENGFKWSPIKSYYRKMSKGIQLAEGWKLRLDMSPRYNAEVLKQEFVLIVTIKDTTDTLDIYTDVVNDLRSNGFVTNDLQVKQQIRQRQ